MQDKPRRRWFAFRLRTVFVLLAVAAAGLSLLIPFDVRFWMVRDGMTRSGVKRVLGAAAYTDVLYWGSGAREAWHYRRHNCDYYVVFGGSPIGPPEKWTVIKSSRLVVAP